MNIIVTGGDIIGLVVGYILTKRKHNVFVVEDEEIGCSIKVPSFKYLENSFETTNLLEELGILYSVYDVFSGILSKGAIHPCKPSTLTNNVHTAYWKKSRLINCNGKVKGITDFGILSNKKALSFSWEKLFKKLCDNVDIVSSNPLMNCDLHIATKPLWYYKDFFNAYPVGVVTNYLSIGVKNEKYIKYDVVYTPFTPGDVIYKIYHDISGYICEFSGDLRRENLVSDLNFLFSDGWYSRGNIKTGYTYLLELNDQPVWPKNVFPIGKMAQWNEKITLSDCIKSVLDIVKRYEKK